MAAASAAVLARTNSYDVQGACFSTGVIQEGANVTANVTSMAALFYANRTARLPAAGCVEMTVFEAPSSRGLVAVATTMAQMAAAAATAGAFDLLAGASRLVLHLADPHQGSGPATLVVTGVWAGVACKPMNGTHSTVRVALPGGTRAGSSVSVECRGMPVQAVHQPAGATAADQPPVH